MNVVPVLFNQELSVPWIPPGRKININMCHTMNGQITCSIHMWLRR